MPEVSSVAAGQIIATSDDTIRLAVNEERLSARREGRRRAIWIEVEELRKFAKEYGYKFSDDLAIQLARN